MRGCTKCGSALGMGALGPFVTILCLLQPPQQLIRPEPFPGQHFPHHPVDPRLHEGRLCGLVIRGIFPPQACCRLSKKSPAQQAQGHVVMPARPSAGLVLVQPHVALLRLKLRFYTPPGASHVCQGLHRGILQSIGQVVAGFAAVQVPAVNGPVDFAGLPPACWTHPLSAEPVAAGILASSATVISRQASSGNSSLRSSMVRRCPSRTSLGLRGRPPNPWYCRTGPSSGSGGHTVKPAGTSRTYRVPKAASPSRNDGDIPKASSPATQPAFRWPRSKARCSISSANWVFDR